MTKEELVQEFDRLGLQALSRKQDTKNRNQLRLLSAKAACWFQARDMLKEAKFEDNMA
jgi:hypothetical protein